jgi:hypothetical protein
MFCRFHGKVNQVEPCCLRAIPQRAILSVIILELMDEEDDLVRNDLNLVAL